MSSGNRQLYDSLESAYAAGASTAIRKTVRVVEDSLGTTFPRGDTPSKDRELMARVLRSNWRR